MAKQGIGFTFESDFTGLHNFLEAMPAKVQKFGDGVAEDMTTDMKLSMGTSPPGRVYIRRNSGGSIVVHVASVPGHPPNPDEASLRNSLKWKRVGEFEWQIEDGVQHGVYMEMGTTRVQPRPFVKPVFEEYGPGGKLASIARSLDLGE